MWVRRLAVGLNAVGTAASGAGIVPGALVYPTLAQAVSQRALTGLGRVALDGALCFGPLVVPGLVVLGAVGLRTAWEHAPDSARINGAAATGWLAVAGAVAALVVAAL